MKMFNCPKCDRLIYDDVDTCPYCGSAVKTAVAVPDTKLNSKQQTSLGAESSNDAKPKEATSNTKSKLNKYNVLTFVGIGILVISLIFGIVSWVNRYHVYKVDAEKLESAMNETFDGKLTVLRMGNTKYHSRIMNREYYEKQNITGFNSSEEIYIFYDVFENEETAEIEFSSIYNYYLDNPNKNVNVLKYNEGKSGYIILDDNDRTFMSYYYADDMILEVSSFKEDSIEKAKLFLESLQLPTK